MGVFLECINSKMEVNDKMKKIKSPVIYAGSHVGGYVCGVIEIPGKYMVLPLDEQTTLKEIFPNHQRMRVMGDNTFGSLDAFLVEVQKVIAGVKQRNPEPTLDDVYAAFNGNRHYTVEVIDDPYDKPAIKMNFEDPTVKYNNPLLTRLIPPPNLVPKDNKKLD